MLSVAHPHPLNCCEDFLHIPRSQPSQLIGSDLALPTATLQALRDPLLSSSSPPLTGHCPCFCWPATYVHVLLELSLMLSNAHHQSLLKNLSWHTTHLFSGCSRLSAPLCSQLDLFLILSTPASQLMLKHAQHLGMSQHMLKHAQHPPVSRTAGGKPCECTGKTRRGRNTGSQGYPEEEGSHVNVPARQDNEEDREPEYK